MLQEVAFHRWDVNCVAVYKSIIKQSIYAKKKLLCFFRYNEQNLCNYLWSQFIFSSKYFYILVLRH